MLRPDTFALTLLLASLTALGPMSSDMYVPSLPDISHSLHVPIAEVQLTISSYLVGFATGQIIYGPISDRLGRKLPADIQLTETPAGTELGDMLARGNIDFLMTANNPLAFRRGSSKVRRLFPAYAAAEKDYYRRTKIYPIMHTVVSRRDIC